MIPYLFSSIFLSKSLVKLLLDRILSLIPYRIFISMDIPSVNEELARNKVYDFFEWGLFYIFSFAIFFLLYILYKNIRVKNKSIIFKYAGYVYLLISIITFFNVQFATHAVKGILGFLLFFNLFYWTAFYHGKFDKKIKFNYEIVFNGFLLGLILSLLLDRSSTLVLYILILFPLFYVLISARYLDLVRSKANLILLLGLIFHDQRLILIIIISITLLILFSRRRFLISEKVSRYLYLTSTVFLLLYNPLFYVGVLDTVEEGFWLGWLQRMINGEFIYRDFNSYHPPFFLWGLYMFSKLSNFSVYITRFYFHILYIVGMMIISLISYKLIKNKILMAFLLLIIFSLTGNDVKNNVEIRLGLGLLPLLLLYSNFDKEKTNKYIIFSGLFTATSLFSSLEVGLTTFISGLLYILIQAKNKIGKFLNYLFGFLIILIPTLFYLLINNALIQLFRQLFAYSKAFSLGYLNIVVDRPFELAFFYWHIFFEYLASNVFYWFFVQISISLILIWYTYKKFIIHKVDRKDDFVFILAFFGIMLSRSALGRSDYYHLLFILIIAFVIFFYFLESVFKKNIYISLFTVTFFILVVVANPIKYFVSDVLHKFQTYGNVSENYLSYDNERSGIFFEADKEFVINKNELISYLEENTNVREEIFTFPWMPELYFLTNRINATSYDTPYAFLEMNNQEKMISQLDSNKPKIVIYSPNFNFGDLNVGSIKNVDDYINLNYSEVKRFGSDILMVRK